MNNLRKEFTTYSITLMAVAIAINIAVGQLVIAFKLPIYLDSIGTVLVGALIGPWAGAVTGFLSNVVWTLSGLFPQAMAWSLVAALIGAMAGWFKKAGWFGSWWKVALAGLITGIISAVLSAPIAASVFGGVTGTGMDAVVAIFRSAGMDALGANMSQGVVSDPFDKLATFAIVWGILLALPKRLKARFGSE